MQLKFARQQKSPVYKNTPGTYMKVFFKGINLACLGLEFLKRERNACRSEDVLHWEVQSLTGDKEMWNSIQQGWVFQFLTRTRDYKSVPFPSLPLFTIPLALSVPKPWSEPWVFPCLRCSSKTGLYFFSTLKLSLLQSPSDVPWFQWSIWKH